MDSRTYSTLMDAVADVPDPRKRRGKRHPWALILTLISAALVCGQHSGRALGQWVEEHSGELLSHLPIPQRPLPRSATLRRAMRALDVTMLEDRLAQFAHDLDAATPPSDAAPWQGQAVDGQALRGAQRRGTQVHLVSLVQHATGRICKQVRVHDTSNASTAVPSLLHDRDLRGTVITMDALLTQQTIAHQILDQHGQYLMIVKENQPVLYAAIELLFQMPSPPSAA